MAADLERLAKEWQSKYPQIANGLNDLAKTARNLGVPESFSIAVPMSNAAAAAEKPTLKTPEASFEIPTVSEEQYVKTHEALAKKGYTFVVAIEPLSIGQLVTGETSQRFGYVNPSEHMRAIVPLQMEVAINPKNLRIKNSNSKSTDDQIKMIKDEEESLKGKLPQEIRDLISMHIQNASTLAQLDDKYQKETGKVLFTNWFGRTDDQTVPGDVADVGRGDPTFRLRVSVWHRGNGVDGVFAVPVVVLPRKLVI